MNYLIDSYVIYAASALAANSVLRSLFGAAFPLFTTCKLPISHPSRLEAIQTNNDRHVPQSRNPLGVVNPRIPRIGMRSIPLPLLQVRRTHPVEVQVRCPGRRRAGADPRGRCRPSRAAATSASRTQGRGKGVRVAHTRVASARARQGISSVKKIPAPGEQDAFGEAHTVT